MIDALFWWVGAVVCGLALTAGLSIGGMLAADQIIRSLGLWPRFFAAMKIMWRQRHEDAGL